MEFLRTSTKQAENEMNIVLDSSSSTENDDSFLSEIWDDDEAEAEDDEEEVACPFQTNVPKFIVHDGEQMMVMSEIGDLIDHVDELLGEIEEQLLQRDQLIQRLKTLDPNQLIRQTNLRVNELIQQANPIGIEVIQLADPVETSSWHDLLELVSLDLIHLKSATDRARECLFELMSERSDLSSMVTLKEKHIQDLEHQKGELLQKLLSTNTLKLNLTEVATPSLNFGQNYLEKTPQQDNSDSEQTIFQLTEKVMRLERRLQCFQSSQRDSDLLSHVKRMECHLAELMEQKFEILKQLSENKLEAIHSLLHDKDIHLSLLQRCQSRFETVLDYDFNQLCTDEMAKLEKESSILKEDIKNEVAVLERSIEARSNRGPVILSNMSSGQLFHLNQHEEGRSRFASSSSQQSLSPEDDVITFGHSCDVTE